MIGQVRQTHVDGIETVLAAGPPGQVHAGLAFRVGIADESMTTRGLSHLVEHLALHEHGHGHLNFNGATTDCFTIFHVDGTEDEVVEYLNGVCRSLRSLPMHRLEVEKDILRAEQAGRSGSWAAELASWRYGARTYGLSAFPEFGLKKLTPEVVQSWADAHFTTENAVLWMSCDDPPEGLDLRLPAGWRAAPPPPTSALPVTPAYLQGPPGGIALQSVVPRSTHASLFATVLGKELFRALRQHGGYSYTAAAAYLPRDSEWATVTALADAAPEKDDAVVGGFVDAIAKLCVGNVEEADLASAKTSALRALESFDSTAGRLPAHAMNLLVGHPTPTDAELVAEIEAADSGDIERVAGLVWDDALVLVPRAGLEWAGVDPAPQNSTDIVSGSEHIALDDKQLTLIVGPAGVTIRHAGGAQSTVRYTELAALHTYPDGGRVLVGQDGFRVVVEPTRYVRGVEVVRAIDAAVPEESVLAMPARTPEQIPGSLRLMSAESGSPPSRARKAAAITFMSLLGLVVLFWIFVSASLTVHAISPPDDENDYLVAAIMGWIVQGMLAGTFVWLWRQLRRTW
jgi:predicted Zn-dependent peptidase